MAFLIWLGFAGWYLITRPSSDALSTGRAAEQSTSPVVLQDFVLTSYRGSTMEQNLTGGKGLFTAPDRLLISGGVTWWKSTPERTGSIRANRATIMLEGDHSGEYLFEGKLDRIVFVGQVAIAMNRFLLHSEQAVYIAQENILRGKEKVTLNTAEDIITGESGFTFDLTNEGYEIFGPVNGVLTK